MELDNAEYFGVICTQTSCWAFFGSFPDVGYVPVAHITYDYYW